MTEDKKTKKIGRYTVVGRLGKGGMGSVYRVIMPVTGKMVALKLLDPFETLVDVMGMDKVEAIFTSEAVIMARLRHPYIADIWDFDYDEKGRPFFIMEYYCKNLGTMIGEHYQIERKSRVISPEEVIHYGSQIIEGLACMHHAGIIHRDIKPFNIMITDLDTVKICDFGMSLQRGEKFPGPDTLKVGSAYYAPPEQMQNPDSADERSDVYAVAVLLYRMLTGELVGMKSLSLSRVNPLYDSAWDRFFEKGLALQPDSRFPDAPAMLDALKHLEIHWENSKKQACRIRSGLGAGQTEAECKQRNEPVRAAGVNAKKIFNVNDLFQPKTYIANRLERKTDEIIIDHATGLLWQFSGSDYSLDRQGADSYIDELNTKKHAGYDQWRLPSVNELLSLIYESTSLESHCAPQYFEPTKKWFWSCDWRSKTTAWYVNMDMGFTGWQDSHCYCYVRAVALVSGAI